MSKTVGSLVALAGVALVVLFVSRSGAPVSQSDPLPEEGVKLREVEVPPAAVPAVPARTEPARKIVPTAAETSRTAGAPSPDPASSSGAPVSGKATLVVRVFKKETVEPIEGVRVDIFPEPRDLDTPHAGIRIVSSEEESIRTDESGVVELDLTPGVRHTLLVGFSWSERAPGEEPPAHARREVEALLPGQRFELLIELPFGRDLVFWGRVRSELGAAPIYGARVIELSSRSSRRNRASSGVAQHTAGPFTGEVVAESDAEGLFALRTRSWSPGSFALSAPGYGPRLFVPNEGHESPDRAQGLRLLPCATLRARIVDFGAGGSSAIDIRLSTPSYLLDVQESGTFFVDGRSSLDEDPTWSTACDPGATCILEGLPAHVPLTVEILRDGDLARKLGRAITLEPGETREVEWSLGTGARLHGIALDQDGEPAAGIEVWLLVGSMVASVASGGVRRCFFLAFWEEDAAATARTGEDGRFELNDVVPGSWWIGPGADSNLTRRRGPHAVSPEATRVEVPHGVAELEVDLRVHRGLYIRGRVVAPDGRERIQAWVNGSGQDFPAWVDTDSEEDGSFVLGPLSPGAYLLQASSHLLESDLVTARAGDMEVTLWLRKGGAVAGRVVDRRTRESRKAMLHVSGGPPERRRLDAMESNDGGMFSVGGLPPGRYDLAAVTRDGQVGFLRGVEVSDGAEAADLSIEVEAGGTVRVRYEGETDYCIYTLSQAETPFAFDGLHTGAVAEHAAPPGAVVAEFSVGGELVERRELQLEVGEEIEVLFAPDR